MSCKSMSRCCGIRCCGITCNDIVSLAVILALGIIFFGDFDQGVFATVIAIVAILALC